VFFVAFVFSSLNSGNMRNKPNARTKIMHTIVVAPPNRVLKVFFPWKVSLTGLGNKSNIRIVSVKADAFP
jgi:hypothetical protein